MLSAKDNCVNLRNIGYHLLGTRDTAYTYKDLSSILHMALIFAIHLHDFILDNLILTIYLPHSHSLIWLIQQILCTITFFYFLLCNSPFNFSPVYLFSPYILHLFWSQSLLYYFVSLCIYVSFINPYFFRFSPILFVCKPDTLFSALDLWFCTPATYVINNYSSPHNYNSTTQTHHTKSEIKLSVLINEYLHSEFLLDLIFYISGLSFPTLRLRTLTLTL